jgi:hypothetical protein
MGKVSLAIIGARTFTDYDLLSDVVKKQCDKWDIKIIDLIVSGGCKGADILGERFAKENHIKTLILKPDWKKYGKSAGFRRNQDIITAATHVIAFPSKTGLGTQHSIKLAEKGS